MSGSKGLALSFNLFVAVAALFVGACTQPVVGDDADDTVQTGEAVLDGDGVRVGRTSGGETVLGGTTIMRGQLEQGPHPDPWNEGPHPDPWSAGSSGEDTGSSGTSGGTSGTAGTSSGSNSSSSGTGTKGGS